MCSLTAEQVIWQSRGSSSIVEVAVSHATFVEMLRGAGQGEWGDARLNCSATAAGELHESAESPSSDRIAAVYLFFDQLP
jgi:hypothetical protein